MSVPSAPVESIDRALVILTALREIGPDGIPLSDLARMVGHNKSTLYRALYTLKQRDFVAQKVENGRYTLGKAALSLGLGYLDQTNLPSIMHHMLVEISVRLGQLVHLGIPVGPEMLYVDKVETQDAIQVRSRVGQSVPAASSAMGRAVMSQVLTAPEQTEPYISFYEQVSGDRPNPNMTVDYLWNQLRLVDERGFSTEIEENESGIACIGVPLLINEKAVGAISVTVLSPIMTEDYFHRAYECISSVLGEELPLGLRIPHPGGNGKPQDLELATK